MNVHLYCGASADVLRRQRRLFADRPVLFWLDAHWCFAEGSAGEGSQSPLLAELAAIGQLHPDSVVLIDDARLYLCAPPKSHRASDWPDFHSVVGALFDIGANHRLSVCNDVIIYAPERIRNEVSIFAQENGVNWLKLLRKAGKKKTRKSWFRFFS